MKKVFQFLYHLVSLVLIIILPFAVLIRGSVFLYEYYQLNAYVALLGGAGITFLILFLYFTLVYGKLFGRKSLTKKSLKVKAVIVGVLLIGYCSYTLIYLSTQNAKTSDVKKEFTALHPFLRMSVGTILFLDSDLLITDLSRAKEDYKKMGLKTLKNS